MSEGDEATAYFGTIIAFCIVALNDILFVQIANYKYIQNGENQ